MAKKERTRAQKTLRVLLVLILLALMGLAGYSQTMRTTFLPENIMVTLFSPVQSFFSSAADSVADYVAQVKLRSNIEYEYNQLKAAYDQMVYRALLAEELEDTNQRLLLLLGEYQQRASMNPLHARVVARAPGNWFSVFTLNKGSKDGVKRNMAVITPEGLIGNVVEVTANECKVTTIIDSNFSVGALIESTRAQGSIRGSLGMDGKALCRMYYLPVGSVPRPGDNVITSGVGQGFPSGLPIGTVRESTRSQEDNKFYIVVEPKADFERIEDVLILRYEPLAEAMPETEETNEQILQVIPTQRPMPTVIDISNVTPQPLPQAPGRPTAIPAATPTPTSSAGANDGANETQDRNISIENQPG